MAIDRNVFSLASQGITSRVVDTWNSNLLRTPCVLVPVQVDALVLRSASEAKWADCRLRRPPGGSNDQTRYSLLPPPFAYLDQTRPAGVYLHWALPDALTHGTGSGSTGTFRPIPDRWLVLRIYNSDKNAPRRAIQGWVLKAGDSGGDPTPQNPYPSPPPIDLDQWSETGPVPVPAQPLTAVGHGDPAWAAYYDNVVNRLGFYDALTGITGPLAYLVCGWYSNSAMDPLGSTSVNSLTDFDSQMRTLGWSLAQGEFSEAVQQRSRYSEISTIVGLPTLEATAVGNYSNAAIQPPAPAARSAAVRAGVIFQPPAPDAITGIQPAPIGPSGEPAGGVYTSDGSWWPQVSVYHGSVVGIGWPNIGWPGNEEGLLSGEFGGPPASSTVKVTIAETITEGLATLAATTQNSPDVARVLEAFALGAVGELSFPDARARIDARLHASAFSGRDDGTSTDEQVQQAAMPPETPPLPQNVSPSGPSIFGTSATQPQAPIKAQGAGTIAQTTPRGHLVAELNQNLIAQREEVVLAGGLQAVLGKAIGPILSEPPQTPAQEVTVKRSKPRLFGPSDPVVLVEGGQLSSKHGGDGRFSQDGTLVCRLSGFVITETSCNALTGQSNRPSVQGEDLLERGVENGSVPLDCEDLLLETVLLDPGSAPSIAAINVPNDAVAGAAVSRRIMVEQTAWMSIRDPRVDHGPLLANSGLAGMLPSPIAVNLPVRPWTPLHLDWEITFYPTPQPTQNWSLDEVDFLAADSALPGADAQGLTFKGRVLLSGGAPRALAQTVQNALTQASAAGGTSQLTASPNRYIQYYSHVAEILSAQTDQIAANVQAAVAAAGGDGSATIDRSTLADIVGTLARMDVLAGSLDGFHTQLRGGLAGDGTTKPSGPVPKIFFPLRAGVMKINRLRLVDCFGQFVDLAGSSDTTQLDPTQLLEAPSVQVPKHPEFLALPPRFTSPARLWLRFMDAGGSGKDADPNITPVCGYVMCNHLDGGAEFFDVNGTNLGFVYLDDSGRIVWQDAPGVASTVGQTPARAITTNSYLANMAQALINWGVADASQSDRETALSALLRTIDSTLWTVDPFGSIGDQHMSLLVGHPVVVMRARVRLEVQEPVTPDIVNQMSLPLRLGALASWQDGLLGYFVNDNYNQLYCADASAAGFARPVGPASGFLEQINLVPAFYASFSQDLQNLPPASDTGQYAVNHPYINTDGRFWIQPNQDFNLTLLVEPFAVVHGRSGLQPSKDVGVRKAWVDAALAALSPTFAFGPVLVDPKRIRMPVAREFKGSWSWDHRTDVTTWAEDPVINSTADPILPPDPAVGMEGWLRFKPAPNGSGGSSGGSGQ